MRERAIRGGRIRGDLRGLLPAPGTRHRRRGVLPVAASLAGCASLAALLALLLVLAG